MLSYECTFDVMQKNAGFLELNWYKPAETAKPLVYAKSQPKNPSKRGPQVLQFEVSEVMVRAMLFFPILRKPLGLLPVLKKRSWKGKKTLDFWNLIGKTHPKQPSLWGMRKANPKIPRRGGRKFCNLKSAK